MSKTSTYWDDRALRRLTDAEKISEEHIKRIKKIYEQAYRNVAKEIERTYKSYSKNTGLDVEKLKELLTKKETDKVWKTLKRQGLDKYIKDNYKARISRLEQIQAQIYAKTKLIYPKEELEHTMAYKGVINESYYKSVYDTQMGTGYDFAFTKIDNNMIKSLLTEKWSGLNYSERIWKNTDILADNISHIIGGAMISGQSIDKTTRQVRERFNVGKYYAERLVRTETNHFNNEADAMAYEEMGVKKYVFIATLDNRTSEICQSHDNKVYNFKDKKVGENYPPLHPNCRSKTRGYISEEVERTLKRRARNPITGKNELIDNMSYKQWAEKNGLLKKNVKKSSKNIKKNVINKPKPVKNVVKYTPVSLLEKLNINANDYGDFKLYEPYDNNIQEKVSKLIGYDKKPRRLNASEYELYKGNEIIRTVHDYHGLTAQEVVENTINGDIKYSEGYNSSFGRGIYFGRDSDKESILNSYASRYQNNAIINAKIDSNAKILTFKTQEDYMKDRVNRLRNVPTDLQKFYTTESSLLYMLDEYDGIMLEYNGYYCIYNRGVLIISDK